MHNKGQLSFDVFLAAIFAMLLVQQLNVISGQMNDTSQRISIASQEKTIANNLAAIISSTAALSDDATSFTVAYTVPKIFDANQLSARNCEITIEIPNTTNSNRPDYQHGTITITYNETNPPTIAVVRFVNSAELDMPSQLPNALKCGDTITIEKT